MKKTLIISMAVCALSAFVGRAYAQDQPAYVGNKQCKNCHNKTQDGEQWNKWKASKHATAFESLATPEAKAVADKAKVDKPAAEEPRCLKCHVTASDEKTGVPAPPLTKADGVQCESCHGPASLHIADVKKARGGDKTVNVTAHIKAKPGEASCKECHNDKSPTWKGTFDFKSMSAKIAHGIPPKKK